MILKSIPAFLILFHLVSGWNYGGGGWHDKIPRKIVVKHIPKHVPVYKPVPIPKLVPVPRPVGFLKPLAIAKPFSVPHVVPVIKHFQKPFPVLKGFPFHIPIHVPKFHKVPIPIKLPKPYVVRVPKPYAVAKKYPVAVPVHIPKPYLVPVLKQVPVAVPHKVPKVINVVKEVPEYVKKPVPVYIEEKPYQHDYGNYKGTPYIPSGGDYKGTPYIPSGGDYKGSPFPSGISEGHKGSPFPADVSGGGKGTPYNPPGKGGSGYHSKGTNVHATSAASFLAAHADKLKQQNSGQGDFLAAYSQNQAYSGLQGLGTGIHGGYHGLQSFGNGYQNFGANFHNIQGSYGAEEHGGYDLHSLDSIGGYDNFGVYGRGAEAGKIKEESSDAGQANAGSHENSGEVTYDDKGASADQIDHDGKDTTGNNAGYSLSSYSLSSYNDQSGRGGGYQNEPAVGGYHGQGLSENEGQGAYQGYGSSGGNSNQDSNAAYGNQGGNGFSQIPGLAIYKLENGVATPLSYSSHVVQNYNSGYQGQNAYENQEAGQGYVNNQIGNGGYGSQNYQQNEESDSNQAHYQQNSYGYQPQQSQYPSQSGQAYHAQQGAGNYDVSSYQNLNNYNDQSQSSYSHQENSEAYHNQASYQINPDKQAQSGYENENASPALQDYGLRAAYPIQIDVGNQNQIQGSTGTVYVRAYGHQGESENQVAYNVQNSDSYQTEDSQPQTSYSAYSTQVNAAAPIQPKTNDEPKAASGRSLEKVSQIVGSSGGYSTPEGGDTKGGSWQTVQ
ncbi:neurogenic protein mastermind-like [Stegodyphus dumicola]|uniref:neurogenic protein mastermind-like n=1 Tax=Stegodyphus dumicola TaxID=202533 RepID=UPI0015AB8B50|nr:neurogenic protein mastermind-like [Stegodyphus dumicola]